VERKKRRNQIKASIENGIEVVFFIDPKFQMVFIGDSTRVA
jgi:DNA repair photolyase